MEEKGETQVYDELVDGVAELVVVEALEPTPRKAGMRRSNV